MDIFAQMVGAKMPHIATQDSGVSWGALLAVLGVIGTIGAAAVTLLFNYIKSAVTEIKAAISEARAEFKQIADNLDNKVEKIESDAREARSNLWQEQRAIKDEHGGRLTKVETKLTFMNTPLVQHQVPE